MKIPSWAPPELVDVYNDFKKKVDCRRGRTLRTYDPREALEAGHLYVGEFYSAEDHQLEIVTALIAAPDMQKRPETLN
jgi:hypothetical protein